MAPRTSLGAFLAQARSALAAAPSSRARPLTFVIGNESADLDSLCSTIVFAYLKTHQTTTAPSSSNNAPPPPLHIPVANLLRDDLALRPEFAAVLHKAGGASPDDVPTLSELLRLGTDDDDNGLRPEDTRWFLVDHNAMTGEAGARYGDRVAGCIDHHVDERRVPADTEPRVVEPAGSCMSLVVRHCREAWDALGNNGERDRDVDAQLATLAVAPILIDTTNLTDRNKTTQTDTDAVTYLEGKIGAASGGGIAAGYDRQALYAEVARLKEDLSLLPTIRDVLRKDYKEWRSSASGLRLGTSSSPQDMAFLVAKAGGSGGGVDAFAAALRAWADERGLGLVAVLTATQTDGVFKRELLLWGTDAAGVAAVQQFLRVRRDDDGTPYADGLGLETWGGGALDLDEGAEGLRRCWTSGNVKDGRKQLAPMLVKAMEESARSRASV